MNNQYELSEHSARLATIGRDMMTFSEDYGKTTSLGSLTDSQLTTLNRLTQVGGMLTKIGVLFGPREQDISRADRELIAKFHKKTLDI
jgi:hypothetical protein